MHAANLSVKWEQSENNADNIKQFTIGDFRPVAYDLCGVGHPRGSQVGIS
jgi:hypothetical protein